MLISDISNSIKRMKQLDTVESAAQDAEKKNRNDNEYSNLVADFYVSMEKVAYANSEMGFCVSDEVLVLADDTVEKLESIISSGVVNQEELYTAKQQVTKKITPTLAKEWKSFHQSKTNGIGGKLTTIGSLVDNQDEIATVRKRINDASEWSMLSNKDDGEKTRLQLLKASIDEVDAIESKLNLSDEIRDFVSLVTKGRAKITDLTPSVLEWINKENLIDKFVISFD